MTAEQFAYWLQGFSEVGNKGPTEEQWKIIQDHLALVFKKLTPTYSPPAAPPLSPRLGPWPPEFFRNGDPLKPYC